MEEVKIGIGKRGKGRNERGHVMYPVGYRDGRRLWGLTFVEATEIEGQKDAMGNPLVKFYCHEHGFDECPHREAVKDYLQQLKTERGDNYMYNEVRSVKRRKKNAKRYGVVASQLFYVTFNSSEDGDERIARVALEGDEEEEDIEGEEGEDQEEE